MKKKYLPQITSYTSLLGAYVIKIIVTVDYLIPGRNLCALFKEIQTEYNQNEIL